MLIFHLLDLRKKRIKYIKPLINTLFALLTHSWD
jgi:hypothetical protein